MKMKQLMIAVLVSGLCASASFAQGGADAETEKARMQLEKECIDKCMVPFLEAEKQEKAQVEAAGVRMDLVSGVRAEVLKPIALPDPTPVAVGNDRDDPESCTITATGETPMVVAVRRALKLKLPVWESSYGYFTATFTPEVNPQDYKMECKYRGQADFEYMKKIVKERGLVRLTGDDPKIDMNAQIANRLNEGKKNCDLSCHVRVVRKDSSKSSKKRGATGHGTSVVPATKEDHSESAI